MKKKILKQCGTSDKSLSKSLLGDVYTHATTEIHPHETENSFCLSVLTERARPHCHARKIRLSRAAWFSRACIRGFTVARFNHRCIWWLEGFSIDVKVKREEDQPDRGNVSRPTIARHD